ncbi:hypothetical protein FB107DRAFT_210485 [Schizophyllum commune]
MRRLSLEERLERASSVANLAMLRTYSEPSPIQIQTINWLTFLLESDLRTLPSDDTPTRARIREQLDINRSILAPIRRLPIEVLSFVFSLVVQESPLRTVNIAVTLSRICTSWRTVARGHAALWTTVVVDNPGAFDDYRELFLPLTKDISLDLRCDDREILGDLWDRMAPYASRWRRVTLEARLSMLSDLKVLHMERLERLVIFAYDPPISTELSVLDFVVAPHLRHIALTLDELQSERQLHVPVTRTLTSLEITVVFPFHVTLLLPLLKACADTLRFLAVKNRQVASGADEGYHTSAPDAFVMKALDDIRLVDPACALLDHITAPVIDELILSHVPGFGARSLMGFLTRGRASQSLRILRVYKPKEREISVWIPCLQLMDNLTQLHFDELLSNEDFLRLMVRRADTPPLLPSLRGVAIYRIFFEHPELHDAIGDMCDSREREKVVRGHQAWALLTWIKD